MTRERAVNLSPLQAQAALRGELSQIRVPVTLKKFQPGAVPWHDWQFQKRNGDWVGYDTDRLLANLCRFGRPGDKLWGREAHCFRSTEIDIEVTGKEDLPTDGRPWKTFDGYSLAPIYRATEEAELSYDGDDRPNCKDCEDGNPHGHWRSSTQMPRWASRLLFEVVETKIERLWDLTEEDARASGVRDPSGEWREDLDGDPDWRICPQCGGSGLFTSFHPGTLGAIPDTDCQKCDTHKKLFHHIWESKHGEGSWDANPYVWVASINRIEGMANNER